ncbi:MAG: DNA phosphorothioation-associated protein 4 [Cyanobacteria bacterium P01_F01_bin.13]
MPLARVQIDVRKAELVKALRASEASTGPFQSYADVMTFAAAVGVRHGKRVPISKQSRYDPDAVPQDQFKNEALISMVAVVDTLEPKILSETDDCDYGRVTIFQEYANGGLEVLEEKLKGTVDYSEQILLILKSEFIENQNDRKVYELKDLIGHQL